MRWDDGNGRITVIHSKTDVEAEEAVVAVTSSPCALLTPSARWMSEAMRRCWGCRSHRFDAALSVAGCFTAGHFLATMRAFLPIVPVAQASTAAADKLTLVVRRQNP